MSKNLTVVLTSGGLDSAVAVALARQNGPVALLHFRYGQQAAEPEGQAFRALCEHYRPSHQLSVSLGDWREISVSPLVSPGGDLEDAPTVTTQVAGSFVPLLSPTMLCAGACWAHRLEAGRLMWGVSLGNLGNYPDRNDAVRLLAWQLVSRSLPEGQGPVIEAPLAQYEKAAVAELARQLNVPVELTWSCLRGGQSPCGRCIGCVSRSKALGKAALRA